MSGVKDCKDCQGSGQIEVETIVLGRSQMIDGEFSIPYYGKGDWHKAVCPCLSDVE